MHQKAGRYGAMRLHEHGIETEDSDIRAHVSVVHKAVYVFRTVDAIEAIKGERYIKKAPATQPGVNGKTTAMGYVMPVSNIWGEGVRKVAFESPGWYKFTDKDTLSTSKKGKLAVSCVRGAMNRGLFPFWLDAEDSKDKAVQIAGTDLIVTLRFRIQVKCDWDCGEKPEGTGNLFLQYAESNPLKKI